MLRRVYLAAGNQWTLPGVVFIPPADPCSGPLSTGLYLSGEKTMDEQTDERTNEMMKSISIQCCKQQEAKDQVNKLIEWVTQRRRDLKQNQEDSEYETSKTTLVLLLPDWQTKIRPWVLPTPCSLNVQRASRWLEEETYFNLKLTRCW